MTKTKSKLRFLLAYCLITNIAFGQAKGELSKSDLIKFDFNILAAKKIRIKNKDAALMPAYNFLIEDANKSLKYAPVSVMDKKDFPPSGDKHDYMSIGPYWWPDPSKPNGIPYIRKDGEINPEVKNFPDKQNFPKLTNHINNLALAFYFSGNEKYAKHATKLLEVWFIDTATKMNPNVKYGQAVKGITEGRAEGVLDTRYVINIIDAINLLQNSKTWTKKNNEAMIKWFTAFSTWINTSKIGIKEMESDNNHGVWFDAQALSVALFIKDYKLANLISARAAKRLDEQMDENGFFPKELSRTTSLHYTAFILDAFTIIAQLSEQTNSNLWTLQTKTNKGLEKGYEALFPYLAETKKWEWPQIKPFGFSNSFQILLKASSKYNCKTCLDIIKKYEKNFETSIVNLL